MSRHFPLKSVKVEVHGFLWGRAADRVRFFRSFVLSNLIQLLTILRRVFVFVSFITGSVKAPRKKVSCLINRESKRKRFDVVIDTTQTKLSLKPPEYLKVPEIWI